MSKFLIFGLGNIGAEYRHSRHNIGFDILDFFVDQEKGYFTPDRLADRAEVKWKGKIFVCIKPTTYMNLSGRAVKYWLDKEKVSVEEILVIVDELALPLSKIRLRPGGSDAGHNGLRDIAAALGTQAFWRLRLGIGHPRDSAIPQQDVADYVLAPPSRDDRAAIDDAIARGIDAWPAIGAGDFERAMQMLHTRKDKP